MNREEAKVSLSKVLLGKTVIPEAFSEHFHDFVNFLYNHDYEIVDTQFDKEMAEERKKSKQSEFMREWKEKIFEQNKHGEFPSTLMDELVYLIDKHKADK